jgi:hypothetical protein
MTTRSQALADADDFLSRMKQGYAAIKHRAESYRFIFRRNVENEIETADWPTRFFEPALQRHERLNEKLTISELIEESEDQLLEAFAFFLCLTPEQQQRLAPQFKNGLERVAELRERNRERARRMLATQGLR